MRTCQHSFHLYPDWFDVIIDYTWTPTELQRGATGRPDYVYPGEIDIHGVSVQLVERYNEDRDVFEFWHRAEMRPEESQNLDTIVYEFVCNELETNDHLVMRLVRNG